MSVRSSPYRHRGFCFLLTLGLAALALASFGAVTPSQNTPHPPISILGDSDFTAANGVTGGSGTASDPYIIEGWDVSSPGGSGRAVAIHQTKASFIIRNVYVHSSSIGVELIGVMGGRIETSRFSDNLYEGVLIWNSVGLTLAGDVFASNGIFILGQAPSHFDSHIIGPDNLVNGKPLLYHKDCNGLEVQNVPVGQLIVVGCRNVKLTDLDIQAATVGIEMAYVNGTLVARNTLAQNGEMGLFLYSVSNFTIAANNLSKNYDGLLAMWSGPLTISGNNISDNREAAIHLRNSTGVTVHHNNLLRNSIRAIDDNYGSNRWDAGYPSGGNYWSDYTGVDACRAADQTDCTGPDGIGDTPELLAGDYGAEDRYPLMQPHAPSPPVASFTLSPPSPDIRGNLTVDATASYDVEDPREALEVRCDWEGDGTWDTNWSTTKVIQHRYAEPGGYRLRLEVRDTSGLISETEKGLTVVGPTRIPGPLIYGVAAACGLAAFSTAIYFWPTRRAWLWFLLPLFFRLKKETALDHFLRGQIYSCVVSKPGISYSEVRDAFSLNNGTATHHLGVLEALGFVKAVNDGRYKRFFPRGSPHMLLGRKLSDLQYRILDATRQASPISPSEVARVLGISRQRAAYNLHQLVRGGLLRRAPGTRGRFEVASEVKLTEEAGPSLPSFPPGDKP